MQEFKKINKIRKKIKTPDSEIEKSCRGFCFTFLFMVVTISLVVILIWLYLSVRNYETRLFITSESFYICFIFRFGFLFILIQEWIG